MKFFIKVNLSKENSKTVTKNVVNLLERDDHEYMLCCEDSVEKIVNNKIISLEDGVKWCDIIITIGGDGTLLAIGKIASDYNKPILGINTGHLGFLTAIEGNEVNQLTNLFNKNIFEIKKHHFLQTRINNSNWHYCLNDVVISKSMYSNTVGLALYSNDNLLMKFSGDGIIIATSTGSTAYSLSVGGPIVDNDLQAMIISPVAPHTLNRTSMVLNKDKHIKIKANDRSHKLAYIAFDGDDHQEIHPEDEITVKLSQKYVSIYTLGKLGQFEKVDKKLKSR